MRSNPTVRWLATALILGLSACGKGKDDPGNAGLGTLRFALSVPGGITINAMNYDVDGPTAASGSVDLTNSLHSLEFVVGGLAEGTGYTIQLSGHDTAGDTCVSQPTPFSIVTLQTTVVAVQVVCTIGDGGYVLADAGTGSVQIDASVVTVDNPTTVCPTIANFGAANAEFLTGTSTMITAITQPAGAAVTFTITPTDGQGAGTIMPTMNGGVFTCTHHGQVQLTVTTTAPLANDAGTCPGVSQSLWITCEPPDCGAGQTLCDVACVGVSDDVNNCGACGVHCDPGATCEQGMCKSTVPACNPGLTRCGGDCINTQTNADNCGACGNACPMGTVCLAGMCGAQPCTDPGAIKCPPNNTCTSIQTDVHNCGACGHECMMGETCQQGVCQPPLPPGADVVVLNDINPFDNSGMTEPSNQTMVTNMVTFSGSGPRNAGKVVLMSRGHASRCGTGECGPGAFAVMESTITAAGMTILNSTSDDLSVIAPDVKVIFLWTPINDYADPEIAAFKMFAAEGGRIVFVGEHEGYYGTGIGLENRFLVSMGALMTNTGGMVDCGYNVLPMASLRPHQITTGMTDVKIACASVIIPGPNDFPLFFDSTNSQLLAGVARINTGP